MNVSKKFRYHSNALVLSLSVLGILVTLNFFFTHHFVRFDLTENKQYSISESTKNTVASLDDIVTIKVFFSDKLPAQFLQHSQNVRDILDEFDAYASGNLNIQFIDPAHSEETQNEVRSLGIPEIKLNVLEKDKYQVQAAYLGIGIFYLDKHEILPVIQNTSNLEYDLLTAIKKASSPTLKKVGFTVGHGEHGIGSSNQANTNDYTVLSSELQKSYKVHNVDLNVEGSLDEIDTLVVAGPKSKLTDYELFQIDQFLMQGKSVIFLVDTVNVAPGLTTAPLDTGLNKLLTKYGVTVQQNFIIDAIHESASFTQGFFQFILPYPFWVKAVPENFAIENPIVSHLESLVLTWTSSLSVEDKENIEEEILVQSSNNSGEEVLTGSTPINLDPNQNFAVADPKQFALAALLRGNFTSAYEGKDIPTKIVEEETEEGIAPISNASERIDSSIEEGKIVVIGDSDFISDGTVRDFPQNLAFILNVVDYTTLDKDLINIRAKSIVDRPLDPIADSEKNIIKIIGIILAPLILCVYGGLRILRRHKKKKRGSFDVLSIQD